MTGMRQRSLIGGCFRRVRRSALLCGWWGLALLATQALMAENTSGISDSAAEVTTVPKAEESEVPAWSFTASALTYLVPDSREFVQPTFTADRNWLHLEARYNYEDLETGSTWIGYNFGGGKKVSWEFTPMLGAVFGNTTGIAPGYEGSLGWWKLELYSEVEFVVVPGDSSGSFFYTWSELTVAPWEWFRIGMVTQRTRLYESDRQIQRGILAGFTYKSLDLSAYVFNPDESKPIWVFAVEVGF